MLRYDKKNVFWLFGFICMMLVGLMIIIFDCLDGDPDFQTFIFTSGFLLICLVPLLIAFIYLVCKNKRCENVDKLGSYVYGVIVRASRRSSIDDPPVYSFDIAVFDGEKIEILTLSFKSKLQGIDAYKCYSYVMDLIKPEDGVCYGNLLPEDDNDELYEEELTKLEDKVKIDFSSIFSYDSPLFIKVIVPLYVVE